MQIRIEATDLPGRSCGPSADRPDGHHNIHVGVQRKGPPDDLLGVVPADAPRAIWTIDCTTAQAANGVDVKGPFIHGRPGARFIYLNWGVVDADSRFTMFRRAKLMFDGVPRDVLAEAIERCVLVGRLGLTDAKGNPLCAAVRTPLIDWSASNR
jgi:hypothetical protein